MPRRSALALVVLLVLSLTTFAQQHLILLDHSGSMKGFYNTSSVSNLLKTLQASLVDTPLEVRIFSDKETTSIVNQQFDNYPWGDTWIEAAFARTLAASRSHRNIWLLTDNIQSSKKAVADDLQSFFDYLRENERVSSVAIYPFLAPFNGTRYNEYDENIGEYNGSLGMLLYQIEIDKSESTVSNFDQHLQSASNAVAGLKEIGWITSSVKLRPFAGGEIEPVLSGTSAGQVRVIPGERDTLLCDVNPPFPLNDPFSLSFEWTPHSRIQNFRIASCSLRVRIKGTIESDFIINPQEIEWIITPDYLTDLSCGRHMHQVTVLLNIPEVRMRNSFRSWRSSFTENEGWICLPLDIRFLFPSNSVYLDQSFLEEFEGKIVGLTELSQQIFDSEMSITTKELYVKFPVGYPFYPTLLILLFLFLLALLIFFMVYFLRWRQSWLLTGSDGSEKYLRTWLINQYSIEGGLLKFQLFKGFTAITNGENLVDGLKRSSIGKGGDFRMDLVADDMTDEPAREINYSLALTKKSADPANGYSDGRSEAEPVIDDITDDSDPI